MCVCVCVCVRAFSRARQPARRPAHFLMTCQWSRLRSVGDELMNMHRILVQCYRRGKPKYLVKDLPQCHLVHHKDWVNWPDTEPMLAL
jgi:hypothetical protein